MTAGPWLTIDGNEAAAIIAHRLSEVCAIYPITPASPMGESADAWSAEGRKNLWGTVPHVIEMQSEAGAAGAVHGALQTGSLATTFTASQGLLLMIPNMYKIAGELTPTVLHVAARSLACQALSIFGDHSDVMAVRQTGYAMLCAGSVQEVMDFATIAHAATLEGRVPVLHFFDGFRTSHEAAKIQAVEDSVLRAMISDTQVQAHRARALSPEHPVLRGSSQNPDVYFQGRERVNPFYNAFPGIVQTLMDRFAELTGRTYKLFDYHGAADAERVIVIMGSGAEAVHETADHLMAQGEKVGLLRVRLYRPFDADALIAAMPPTVRALAVLDRTKEPGSDGEPLYKDVMTALAQAHMQGDSKFKHLPRVIGGRYGLSSKEFTPGMIKAVFDELGRERPKHGFTIGIHDDVSHTSLPWDAAYRSDAHAGCVQALFYGLGSDGTVSANKNSIKIIGEDTDLHAQGYFVYDSKKSGAVTVSHLRFGPQPIRSTYLIGDNEAQFIACHQPVFLQRYDMLDKAAEGAIFLLNSPESPDTVWDTLPRRMQQQMLDKHIRFYTIDAYQVAQDAQMGKRINTIMQTCFFAISGVLPREQAIAAIKHAVEKTYGRKGQRIVEFNFRAIDAALASLHEVKLPVGVTSVFERTGLLTDAAPDFVRRFTAELIAGRGDDIPVSLMPVDGSFPLGTAAYEKRDLALEIPVWDADLCTQCGKCPLVCPHGVIRSKLVPASLMQNAPETFKYHKVLGKDYPQDHVMMYQVAPEDCTGCGLCVDICPIRDKSNASHKALNMAPIEPLREAEKANWAFFLSLPEYDRREVKFTTIKGSMLLQPLFEFSGACVGCGETPYVKLASQLFGDRMLVANATGCSSIYGGNLPTTPWATNAEGRGPAWNNSLFEDNAEFGLGMRVAIDKQIEYARELVCDLKEFIGEDLAAALRALAQAGEQGDETAIAEQRLRVSQLRERLKGIDDPRARELEAVAENLVSKSVWIMGGDGWAYDIGYGGLDHVLASGRNVNILVLDTEVYSNTGGQASKATPIGAVAKFAASGKKVRKKDLGAMAMTYGYVYVTQVAMGASQNQFLKALREAEAYPGPSLVIAYSPCINHGLREGMDKSQEQQKKAVDAGYWHLYRFNPLLEKEGKNPFELDSKEPDWSKFQDFLNSEVRYTSLKKAFPKESAELFLAAEDNAKWRYNSYKRLASMVYSQPTQG
ncbi:MAG TPA: pyruvate:ferredoxin (flavodoxin) oxidoreductase [Gammaproteobacteria bacterium]|nr:pyruvate:ferredoxin (flavodoxin) oxidoreductase [Gammaproteobacteria bacterium]